MNRYGIGGENTRFTKDRQPQKAKGTAAGKNKLMEEQVLALLKSEHPHKLAADFGVSKVTAHHIRTGVTWTHVTGLPKKSRKS